jgi:hypothetical protein
MACNSMIPIAGGRGRGYPHLYSLVTTFEVNRQKHEPHGKNSLTCPCHRKGCGVFRLRRDFTS